MKAGVLGTYTIGASHLAARANTSNSGWTGSPDTTPKPAGQDDFYSQEGVNFDDFKLGDIIRHREVGFAHLTNVSKGYQLAYRTENTFGNPEVAVTTVIIPENNGGEDILSYQIYEDASWIECSPSLEILSDQASSVSVLQQALNDGLVVNTPDYEGFNSSFGAGVLAGKLTLDSIRAVKAAQDITQVNNTNVAVWGYSGGSIATGWAAELHPSYAPDLDNIKAFSVGGYVVDVLATMLKVNKGPYVGFIPAGIAGLASEYTQLWDELGPYLNQTRAPDFLKALKQCTTSDILEFLGQDVFSYFTIGEGILENTLVKQILQQVRLGKTAPQVPFYIYQALGDQIAPIGNVDTVAEFYCDNGTPLIYNRVPNTDHTGLGASGAAPAYEWLKKVLGGDAPQGCKFEGAPLANSSSSVGPLTATSYYPVNGSSVVLTASGPAGNATLPVASTTVASDAAATGPAESGAAASAAAGTGAAAGGAAGSGAASGVAKSGGAASGSPKASGAATGSAANSAAAPGPANAAAALGVSAGVIGLAAALLL